ncbi:S-adenosyl-L-methionine-dependent methyltransferase [Massarina eburnea CBS 473.64]|uniref:S-adenosyl-L-methionine-dependent methyltransferase n=1 Tax=Massarina eburnea CBS 473.64 TaxID=1395130 RepID=A0A6A6RJQ6_9PLEO|nr:S-adenosyl-L-methionine-dependent methyltransferase [Massarina eburnea CBS 473.64]
MTAQDLSTTHFNTSAATWDTNKKHVEGVEKAFEAITRHIPAFSNGTAKNLDVLEIGCGTGLLTFLLAPHVRSIIGIDTSPAMIDAFNTKIGALASPSSANLAAITLQLHDADDVHLQGACAALAGRRGSPDPSNPAEPYRFDLVVSHLTLHHVPEMGALVQTLFGCLKHGGRIALTDYEDFGPEAVRFHRREKRKVVERHGVKREEILDVIDGVGFNECRVETAFSLRKSVEDEEGKEGGEMEFPFWICLGEKS